MNDSPTPPPLSPTSLATVDAHARRHRSRVCDARRRTVRKKSREKNSRKTGEGKRARARTRVRRQKQNMSSRARASANARGAGDGARERARETTPRRRARWHRAIARGVGVGASIAFARVVNADDAHAKTRKESDGGARAGEGGGRERARASWVTTASGALAGGCARVCVAPLDVIKIRLQVQVESRGSGKYRGLIQAARVIVKEEGARAMWAGTIPALFLWVPYTAIQFTVLAKFRDVAAEFERRNPGSMRSVPVSFLGGAVAGSTATVATYPFDVIRTLLASQGHPKVYNSILEAARGVVRERGVAKGLFAGVSVTLAEIVPASAVQFGSYAALKTQFPKVFEENDFACGFAAGSIARLVVHPLDVVKKRFQVAGFSRSLAYGQRIDADAYRTFFTAVRTIAAREGVFGFYKGLGPSLIKSAPASAITFSVFEAAHRALTAATNPKERAH